MCSSRGSSGRALAPLREFSSRRLGPRTGGLGRTLAFVVVGLALASACQQGSAAPGGQTIPVVPPPVVAPSVTPTASPPVAPTAPPVTQVTSEPAASSDSTSLDSASMTDAATSSPSETTTDEPAEVRGPTPKSETANFPFPQNRSVGTCTLPAVNRNSDVIAAFEKWKAATVTSDGANGALRVKRLESDPKLELGSTVSEGIAYGMLIAVYMNEQAMFDDFWRYSQQWLDENGLMHWYINAAGTEPLGTGAASDADEDIAFALIMADRQWGGQGSLDDTYLDLAKTQMDRVWQHEVLDGKLLKAGDTWGGWGDVNVSYFAPSYYRTFASVSGNEGWLDVVQTTYDTLTNSMRAENGNSENGLVPAWCTSDGEPNNNVWQDGSAPTHYQYDSCRTPFRIGLDYCFFSEPRAQEYVAKTTGFFANIGAANIVDGYDLDGTPHPDHSNGSSLPASFVGPAAVGASYDAANLPFIDEAYTALATLEAKAGTIYYQKSWTALSLLMLNGAFIEL